MFINWIVVAVRVNGENVLAIEIPLVMFPNAQRQAIKRLVYFFRSGFHILIFSDIEESNQKSMYSLHYNRPYLVMNIT